MKSVVTDELIALALEVRSLELWNSLSSDRFFSVALPDGDIGYCVVMGAMGQHYGVAFYRGEEGLHSLLSAGLYEGEYEKMLYTTELMSCLNCDFSSASELSAKDKQRVKDVAKTHGLAMCKRNAYPQFICYEPRIYPHDYYNLKDVDDMRLVLMACKDVARMLKDNSPEELGFPSENYIPYLDELTNVPLLIPQDDGSFKWTIKKPTLEKKSAFLCCDVVPFKSDLLAASVARLPEDGDWYVLPMQLYHPMPESVDQPAHYMRMYLLISQEGDLLPIMPSDGEVTDEALLLQMANVLISQIKVKPRCLYCINQPQMNIFREFCQKTGINLESVNDLMELQSLYECYSEFKSMISMSMV